MSKISIGMIGTSWWTDAMYLPALQNHPMADVVAICGRKEFTTNEIADRWKIPGRYTDVSKMFASETLDAVIIATANDSHHAYTMQALEKGLHVLCEKPLALSYKDAKAMADLAEAKGLVTMIPFTYSFMPTARYLKELIDSDYLGKPYHLNMRYYTGYGRTSDYIWRFDKAIAGSGAVGDIGSHFLFLAYWFFGEITGVFARLDTLVEHAKTTPDGKPYEVADDTAMLILKFKNGAQGSIQASTLAYEETHFGQIHQMELYGSSGSLRSFTDWNTVQEVQGARVGEGAVRQLEIPSHIWGNARRDTVQNTYKDMFRQEGFMTQDFVSAITEKRQTFPTFREGAYIQKVLEAALKSDQEKRWVELSELDA
jgi:predicted dehydrogenase